MRQRSFALVVVSSLLLLLAPAIEAGTDPVYPAPLAQVLRVDADGSDFQQLVPAAVALGFSAIDVDPLNQRVYWASFGESLPGPAGFSGRIRRADLGGGNVQEIVVGEGGVKLDPAGNKVYYTIGSDCDPCTSIYRANLNGSNVQNLANGVSFTPLALDLVAEKIYWYDQGEIISANLDGSGQQPLIGVTDSVSTMAVDSVNQKLYWTGSPPVPFSGTLYRVGLDGIQLEELVTGLSSPAGLTLDVAGDRLWWTEYEAGTIRRAHLDGSDVTTIRDDLDEPRGIAYLAGPGQDGGRLYFLGNPQLVSVPATSAWGVVALFLVLGVASRVIASR